MFVISNNCCGGWIYKLMGMQFNNPFIWMVCPLSSIYNIILHFPHIDWSRFTIQPSGITPNTYKICVDNLIELHYVHYVFNPLATTLIEKRSYDHDLPIDSNEVEYCKIWEYVVKKYVDRTTRMMRLYEQPIFVLSDLPWYYYGKTPHDILSHNCSYKRILFTESNTYQSYDNCHIIQVPDVKIPMQLVKDNLVKIKPLIT